jgi:hypothetical protein
LTQETADAPTQPASSAQPQKKSAQPQKKAKQPAGTNEKALAKRDREAPQAAARAKGSKHLCKSSQPILSHSKRQKLIPR